jgi:hypothetical protein
MLHLRWRGLEVARQTLIHGGCSLAVDFPDVPSFICLRVRDSDVTEWRVLAPS